MGRVHGKNANFSYNAVAMEDELDSIIQTATVPKADITAFNDAWQNVLAGKKSVATEVAGTLDPAAGAGDATLFAGIGAGPLSTIFDPTGSGPGANDPEYQCTLSGLTGALVKSYRITLPVGERAGYSATLQHSGSTTRAVA